ncbi:hypothetical protein SUGI_0031420 [Cryptomeria japonica]|nr:hypothetical protein SUGI_0031420 [Cryptomeria japonica]
MSQHNLPAHQLVDFDWKLKYAVSSSSLATMTKPLLRLELCISNAPQVINEPNSIPDHQPAVENPLVLVSEYNKVQLDNLISEMEEIEKALDESPAK